MLNCSPIKHLVGCAALSLAVGVAIQMSSFSSVSAQERVPERQLTPLSAVAPVLDCEKLSTIDISSAVGAKTRITSAEVIPEGKPSPYCRVTGYVEPMVKFEVRLPLMTWTQRFVQTGCGGLCGNLNIRLDGDSGCYPAQHGELALSSTDMGHTGGMDGEFGEKDYQLRIDFAYRGVHVTTLASKALIYAFYGQGPKYSYFEGCSDGGREALMEAERYPSDFNGIAAGAPAMNFTTQNTFYHAWNAAENTGLDGKPILTTKDLPILHRAALQACDSSDGIKDGLISDPLNCKFDPAEVECSAGTIHANCLTHTQVETARAIYQGAHSINGDKLVLSGPLPGSELAWAGVFVPLPGDSQIMSAMIAIGSLKHLIYEKNPLSSYNLSDLQYTPESFNATTKLHALYDATDPDLTQFAKAGGKLILWHGLADPHISPLNTIAYYTAMTQIMGPKAVQAFVRLYLFPGGYHCGGGEGPFRFDLLSAMMAWVEHESPPFSLLASQQISELTGPTSGVLPGTQDGGIPPSEILQGHTGKMPPVGTDEPRNGTSPIRNDERSALSTQNAYRTRPVYPYPLTAKYVGSGSIDDAKNFSVGPEKPVTPSQLQWLGSRFYIPHYEVWCRGQGTAMTCKSKP